MADKENQGLLYIQNVKVYVEDELTRSPEEIADYPDVIHFLSAVPRDTLRQFSWNSWHIVPAEALRLLWSRQSRLTNVELVPTTERLDNLAAAAVFSESRRGDYVFHENATSLRIADVGRGTIPDIALQLLRYRPKIDTLTLDFWDIRRRRKGAQLPVHHAMQLDAYRRGLLLKEIFCPPDFLQPLQRLNLKALHLYAVDLSQGCQYMLTALNTQVLKTLTIISCAGIDNLLLAMSRLPVEARPQLCQLEIFYRQKFTRMVSHNNHTDPTTESINDLLLSTVNTISTLWVVLRGISDQQKLLSPLTSGLENHSKSLVRLTLDIRTRRTPFVDKQFVGWFPQEDWKRICASMTRLEQLQVPFPPIVADGNGSMRSGYKRYAIATLRSLMSTTYPYMPSTLVSPSPDQSYIEGPDSCPLETTVSPEFYVTCVSHLAQQIRAMRSALYEKPARDLDVVGFGLSERGHFLPGFDSALRPMTFVKSKTVTLGKEEITMKHTPATNIWRSELAGLISGLRDIDARGKRRRRTNHCELRPF
ncbi:MAG: hypothetical protein Q9219_000705 [cf. Caloplaca sp. 3 TL-2023]